MACRQMQCRNIAIARPASSATGWRFPQEPRGPERPSEPGNGVEERLPQRRRIVCPRPQLSRVTSTPNQIGDDGRIYVLLSEQPPFHIKRNPCTPFKFEQIKNPVAIREAPNGFE